MSFDPGVYTNKKQHKYEVITVITNTMNMLTMTLVAMLLSTASARTLKGSDDDPHRMSCEYLYICATNELVGDKKLTTNNPNPRHGDHGVPDNDVLHYDAGWCKAYRQSSFGYGPDVEDLEFYLDGVFVHKGHYQQNYCGFEAGDITTDDPNAEIRKGGGGSDGRRPGYVIIKAW